jgi:hypothetical protein
MGNEDLKQSLLELKEKYLTQNHDPRFLAEAFGRILYNFAPQTDADLQWVQDEIMAYMNQKLEKQNELREVGAVTAMLVGHGSSFEHAKKAMAQWLLISETKVRDAYYKVRKEYGLSGDKTILDNHDFRMTFIYELSAMQKRLEKPFPEDYPKAHKAMTEALKAEDAYARLGTASFKKKAA